MLCGDSKYTVVCNASKEDKMSTKSRAKETQCVGSNEAGVRGTKNDQSKFKGETSAMWI